MPEWVQYAVLAVGLIAVVLLGLRYPALFRSPPSETWSERVANERGWRQLPRRAEADSAAGGSYLPFYNPLSGGPSSGGDCGGGGGGGGDCGAGL